MIVSAIGGHVPNSYAVVTLFGVDGLLLIIVDRFWSSRCLIDHIDLPDNFSLKKSPQSERRGLYFCT